MADGSERTPAIGGSQNFLSGIRLDICVSLGKARPAIHDLLDMEQGTILPLDRNIDDPVELYIGDKLIARGELQELETGAPGQIAVRLTEIIDLKDCL